METIISDNGTCIYHCDFYSSKESSLLFKSLRTCLDWRQDPISLYGKEFMIPRLHCWYGEFDYSYSKIKLPKREFPKPILEIKHKIEKETGLKFNGVLANLYRDGQDSNGWHSDNESELERPVHIASLSLGQERSFHLRKRGETKLRHKVNLEDGSLLIMKHPFQEFWQHQIPKTKRVLEERINLTFRKG